jgi:hypothetical protein
MQNHVQSENTHHAQVTRQFTLVTHPGQRRVGAGINGGLMHGRGDV